MIFLKTDDEIELLRQSNLLVGRTLAEVAKMCTFVHGYLILY